MGTQPSESEAAGGDGAPPSGALTRIDEALDRIEERARAKPFLAAVLVVLPIAAVPRWWALWKDQGVFWPDEIYQSLEQAHRVAFGYGFLPWEFRDGARSWVFPGFFAIVLKVASLLGAHSGVGLVLAAKAVMVLFGLGAVFGAMKLAHALAGLHAAIFAGAVCALYPANIVYGPRCMSEMAAATLLVLAVAYAVERPSLAAPASAQAGSAKPPLGARFRSLAGLTPPPSRTPAEERAGRRGALLSGIFIGLAIYVRYQSGLIAIFLFLLLVVQRRRRELVIFTLTALALGLAGGLLDRITWGHWFHSFVFYVRFNWIEGRAALWGIAPPNYYWECLTASTGPILWVGLLGLVLALPRARLLVAATVLFYVAHARIPHKEFRFLMPIVPLAAALMATGYGVAFEWLEARWSFRRIALGYAWSVLTCAAAGALVHRLVHITFADMGAFLDHPEVAVLPPWHHDEGPNLALWAAGKKGDLCGITVVGTPIISIGGYTYLHRDVPMLQWFDPSATNYLVLPRLQPPPEGYRVTDGFPDYVLARREGPCAPPPPWYTRDF